MKNKIINFVIKANHIIFFLASCVVIAFAATKLIQELSWSGYEEPKIEVFQDEPSSDIPPKIKYSLVHWALIEDIHVFKIKSNRIKVSDEEDDIAMFNMFSGGSNNNQGTVNLLFVKSNENSYKLFPHDFFLYDFKLSNINNQSKTIHRYGDQFLNSKNIYTIINSDTDADGFLSDNDMKNLFLSDYNGKNIEIIMNDIEMYEMIGDDLMLIMQNINENPIYSTFNIKTKELIQLQTSI